MALDAGQSLTLLARCAGARLIQPGLGVGDLAYWTAALKFAGGFVMAGRRLPGLERDDADFRACWQPVASADIARVRALAAAMPPAARAVDMDAATQPPDVPAERVLRRFLGFTVDALVRGASQRGLPSSKVSTTSGFTHSPRATAKGTELASLASRWSNGSAPSGLRPRLRSACVPGSRIRTGIPRHGWSAIFCKANRHPSLILPTAEAWDLKPHTASALGKDAAAIREHPLSSLGQAAGIYPPIEASLRGRAPKAAAWT